MKRFFSKAGGTAPPLSCRTSPPQGGRSMSRRLSPIFNVEDEGRTAELPISLLVGEMSGRTEGGAKDRRLSTLHQPPAHRHPA
ncbi:hypothetical protein FJ548_02240 [Mesorhizobium sp. B2-4-17]|nr:hypothetical protein FJ548_02240 [Mesorhizobium sp. B2-4-17]